MHQFLSITVTHSFKIFGQNLILSIRDGQFSVMRVCHMCHFSGCVSVLLTPLQNGTDLPHFRRQSVAFFVTVKTCLWQIRAKEAAKTQAALTRDPKEDKKTDMMERLPTLIRCLRTYPLPLV